MLNLVVKISTELSDCSEITVTDSTDEQVIIDPETLVESPDTAKRYGNDNPPRNTLGLFLVAHKMNSDSTYSTLAVDNSTPSLVTNWTVPITKDGWIRFTVIGIPNWNSAVQYDIGEYVQYDNRLYKAIDDNINQNPFSNTLTWETVSDVYSIRDEDGVYKSVVDDVITCRSRTCVGKAGIAIAEECCNDCKKDDKTEYFLLVSAQLSALEIASCEGRYRTAEKVARQLEVNCKSGKCKTC